MGAFILVMAVTAIVIAVFINYGPLIGILALIAAIFILREL